MLEAECAAHLQTQEKLQAQEDVCSFHFLLLFLISTLFFQGSNKYCGTHEFRLQVRIATGDVTEVVLVPETDEGNFSFLNLGFHEIRN